MKKPPKPDGTGGGKSIAHAPSPEGCAEDERNMLGEKTS